ncbi:MAG: lytic transglycosylase domain-containing protein [Candidatus Rokuibacteriota bacterium]
MLTRTWTRYRDADRRQLPLFPEWERARWLAPVPSLGAALALSVLVAVGTPSTPPDALEQSAALTESVDEIEIEDEIEDAPTPEYDLAAIPDHIKAAAVRYQLSERLIRAVISVESNFDHAAVSHKGARGLMQLMPKTAALIGVRDPHDPDENIDAGASHLRAMLDTFKGNLPLALAAYNAGEQHVRRHRGIPPFPETRRFVARVLRKMGGKKAAQKVLGRPVPAPRWVSRTPRRPPKVQVVSSPPPRPTPARPAVVPVPAPRAAERAPQLVWHETEPGPGSRTWSPLSPREAPPIPAPTVPLGQAP